MTFFNFLCQNEKLSETMLEPFPDSTVTTLTIFSRKKICTKETPRNTITLEGLWEKIATKADRGFRAHILTCVE